MKNKLPYFFFALSAALAIAALILMVNKPKAKEEDPSQINVPTTDPVVIPPITDNTHSPLTTKTPEEILANLSDGENATDPSELINQISDALSKGDMAKVSNIVGKDAMNAETFALLNAILKMPHNIREVGEIELNKRTRWALEVGDDENGKQQIIFDLHQENGKWKIEKISATDTKADPNEKASVTDPLALADNFLQAVLKQEFEVALKWVDLKSVSETRIAALCIIFEEGQYKIRKNKPLRAMFHREDTVGYLAHVETPEASLTANISLNLRLNPTTQKWQVFEINLDQLLDDYAKRVAGGDLYYSPLVKSPSGGETLALYFEFNEDSINPRTQRQLEIVAAILKNDSKKKITLSGHTDALGTKTYNDQLSSNRAEVVRDFLNKAGVSAEQIVTIAQGASQPRRPNITETGEDNPQGRRANRRTEIYLDF
jgi:OOP family OmpA-OmpF porin